MCKAPGTQSKNETIFRKTNEIEQFSFQQENKHLNISHSFTTDWHMSFGENLFQSNDDDHNRKDVQHFIYPF